ncbi:MAG: hypothetical protein GYA78_06470 [Caldisericales bacterium]|jgi:hypothetical protein|nr:hypothetical protein [Caldisericia bacterium]NMD14975.1 hypothetical protein [Caldisericales bacterium]
MNVGVPMTIKRQNTNARMPVHGPSAGDTGDRKWRIKRDLLAKNPRVILSAYSRIVVVDSEGLAFCGY